MHSRLVVVVVGVVGVVVGNLELACQRRAPAPTELRDRPRNPKGHTAAEDLKRQQTNLKAATAALAAGQHNEANVAASRALGAQPPAALALDALWVRARARVALGRSVDARADLLRFVQESPAADPRRPEVQALLQTLPAP